MSKPPIPPYSFDEEAQELPTLHDSPLTYPQADARPGGNKSSAPVHADSATPQATCLILSPFDPQPSEIRSLERRNTEMKSRGIYQERG